MSPSSLFVHTMTCWHVGACVLWWEFSPDSRQLAEWDKPQDHWRNYNPHIHEPFIRSLLCQHLGPFAKIPWQRLFLKYFFWNLEDTISLSEEPSEYKKTHTHTTIISWQNRMLLFFNSFIFKKKCLQQSQHPDCPWSDTYWAVPRCIMWYRATQKRLPWLRGKDLMILEVKSSSSHICF